MLSFCDVCLIIELVPFAQGQHIFLEVLICMAPRLLGEGLFTSMPDLETVSQLPTSRSHPSGPQPTLSRSLWRWSTLFTG